MDFSFIKYVPRLELNFEMTDSAEGFKEPKFIFWMPLTWPFSLKITASRGFGSTNLDKFGQDKYCKPLSEICLQDLKFKCLKFLRPADKNARPSSVILEQPAKSTVSRFLQKRLILARVLSVIWKITKFCFRGFDIFWIKTSLFLGFLKCYSR